MASADEEWSELLDRIASQTEALLEYPERRVREIAAQLLDDMDRLHRAGLADLLTRAGPIDLNSLQRSPYASTLLYLYGEATAPDPEAMASLLSAVIGPVGFRVVHWEADDGQMQIVLEGSGSLSPEIQSMGEALVRDHYPDLPHRVVWDVQPPRRLLGFVPLAQVNVDRDGGV